MSSRSIGVQALALLLTTALCGCSIVGLGYRAAPKHKTGHQESERLSQLAQLYEKQGHSAGAMRLYRQALQVNPKSQEARERLMALSSQHATPPQSPASATPTPTPAGTTMLAQTATPAVEVRPATAAPVPAPAVASAGSPALAPEPPTTPIRAVPTAAPVQRAVPETTTQPDSVIAESASAVAVAAAPILALMTPPTGNSSLRNVHRTEAAVSSTPQPAVPVDVIPAEPKPLTVSREPEPLVLAAPLKTQPAPLDEPAQLESVAAVKLDPPATLVINTSPRLPPRIQPLSTPSTSDWTSSRSTPKTLASVPAPSVVPAPQSETVGIAIRPQNATEEIAGRATLHSSEWAATDLVRLCPNASDELLAIVKQLESPESMVRKDGLIELAELADKAQPVAAAVRALFHDPDPSVKAHAAWAACRTSGVNEEALSVLASVTRSNDPAGATFAAYCLGLLEADATAAVPALQLACESENTFVRLCAAEALLKITPAAAEPMATLIDGLQDSSPEHRWLAALSLSAASSVYQESAVLALIPALHDPVADVCSSAALALGAYGPAASAAAPELQAVLSHPDADVRDAASAALECIVQ
jgi:hypothetical protein